ncbi:hypothetical protein [Kamptonema sp. UHCC 0994]|uniref:hypothetical protein n=1 Tax=Kamptonema sp. UHCC 0994 TaxID=3031329 RepID=UPI0023B974A7|nr:hypothetical protein [Kamptonema sp. UHCC 0994]MDF0555055.1 hypothetical protein [Kamptonema sp. UHCC 0994]
MNHANFKIIDPSELSIPKTAVIQKVLSDEEQLPTEQHDKALQAFLISDLIASGIGKDLAFVDKIPGFIKEIIDNKLWECLYVAKGVVTPYYCRYTKSIDSENFRAFITAKRPNGLETSVETVDRVLQADPEVQRRFRAIIYESRQGERTDITVDENRTSPPQGGKLKHTQQERLRAANRAAEAIPAIGELLDRGLIAIDIAAQLGRDIKDPDNLTAEERDYVDKRDLVGVRINQYIHTSPIPDDEDKEPAYGRELNRYVKELLGVKDRSKSIRMDNPKKAAEKLLTFYKGDRLKELIDHLREGLEPPMALLEPAKEESPDSLQSLNSNAQLATNQAEPFAEISTSSILEIHQEQSLNGDSPILQSAEDVIKVKTDIPANQELSVDDLAKRLKLSRQTILNRVYDKPNQFLEWVKQRDPEGLGWQRSKKKKGRSWLFTLVQ